MKLFQSQIRLRKWQLDEQRRQLADLQLLEARLKEDRQRLDQEVLDEQAAADGGSEAAFGYANYAAHLVERRARLQASIVEIEGRVTSAANDLSEAFSDLKRFELAAAAAADRSRRQQDRRDRIRQDEIGLDVFRRRAG